MTDGGARPLAGMLVVEIGQRTGAALCGSLMSDLGATVVVVEPPDGRADPADLSCRANWRDRLAAGKLSWVAREDDTGTLRELVARADLVIASSDRDPAAWKALIEADRSPAQAVVCDITAYGHAGPLAHTPDADDALQARLGITFTTGQSDGPPVRIALPIVECLTAVNAAGASLAALRHRLRGGGGQTLDMALYDSGFAAMSSFFSRLLVPGGGADSVRRLGNRHTLSAPWNVYRTADGWLLICTGSNDQWKRLCALMQRPELAQAPRFLNSRDRVQHVAEVDEIVQAWIGARTTAACVQQLVQASVPCGPIAPIDGYPREPNLAHRSMVRAADAGGRRLPASPLRLDVSHAALPVPMPDAHRAQVATLAAAPLLRADEPRPWALPMPLADLRVVEIGHYTTAPISARHLAALGADVVKVEPPDGEAARNWAPHHQGQSVFYTVSNSDKRAVTLELSSDEGRRSLRALLSGADVLVENLKPGTLAKHGFGCDQLQALNPRLVTCAVTGFGHDALYAGRPAFDTVVQGMSGLMAIVRSGGLPVKTGMSSADVMGAGMAVAAIVAALIERERTGRGRFIDLSMQDIVCWATQCAWDGIDDAQRLLEAADGHVLWRGAALPAELAAAAPRLSRSVLCERLAERGLRAVPVATPHEVVNHPHTAARRLHFELSDERGTWPALAVPMRLSRTPPRVHRPGPALGRDNAALLQPAPTPGASR